MKHTDDILEWLLRNENAYEPQNIALELNITREEVVYHLNRIREYKQEWIPMWIEDDKTVNFIRINYEDRKEEIERFLQNGGFRNIEAKDTRKEALENENLILIKKQQKEIERNKKLQEINTWIAIISLLIALATFVCSLSK